jgi:flagellar hook assembly protein FlgD
MKIYDPNGSYFRTLMDAESKTAGSHTIEWDGTDDTGKIISTEGDYSVEVTLTDSSGNVASTRKGSIAVYK